MKTRGLIFVVLVALLSGLGVLVVKWPLVVFALPLALGVYLGVVVLWDVATEIEHAWRNL